MFGAFFILSLLASSIEDLSILNNILIFIMVVAGLLLWTGIATVVENRAKRVENDRRRKVEGKQYVVYAALSAVLAKMAKADGRVDENEIISAVKIFEKIAGSRDGNAFKYCVEVFRVAKDDEYTVYQYAEILATAITDNDARMLMYEFLWDMANADGILDKEERQILYRIPAYLNLPTDSYEKFLYVWHNSKGKEDRANRQQKSEEQRRKGYCEDSKLYEAYQTLGCTLDMTDEQIRSKYRELARRHHPDVLRNNGISDEMIKWATEKMSSINVAWDVVKASRGM